MNNYFISQIIKENLPSFLEKYPQSQRIIKILKNISSCKTEEAGGHSVICDDCGNIKNVFNSCGDRHCPNCHGLKQIKWIDKRKNEVLNTDYFHAVFTVPSELNNIFISNKKLMYKLLFDISSEVLKNFAKDEKYLGADIGFISILHTHGSNLSFHPHIHVILLGGGLTSDLKFKHSKSNKFIFPVRAIANSFRYRFMEELDSFFNKNKIEFYSKTDYLKDDYSYQKFSTLIKNKKWNVNIKETLHGAENVIEYLGNYTHRIAISNSRIVSVTENTVTFKYKDYRTKENLEMTLHPLEFLRRFTMHILPKGFIKIRNYGILSNRSKKVKINICRNILKGTYPKSELDGLNGAEIILKLFGVDVFKCDKCGSVNLSKDQLVIQRK